MRGTTIATHNENCAISHTEYFVHNGNIFITDILKSGEKVSVAWRSEHPYYKEAIEVGGNLCTRCGAEMPIVTSRDDAPKTKFGRWLEKLLFDYDWSSDKKQDEVKARREAGGVEITLTSRPRVSNK